MYAGGEYNGFAAGKSVGESVRDGKSRKGASSLAFSGFYYFLFFNPKNDSIFLSVVGGVNVDNNFGESNLTYFQFRVEPIIKIIINLSLQ